MTLLMHILFMINLCNWIVICLRRSFCLVTPFD
nr:MAG TPA: hypothetical protein [Caudoviricetes sp.]